jgi:hypothetical protein
MKSFFRQPFDDVIQCLERLVTVKRPGILMVGLLFAGIATWFIYVPIHELLHAAGCVVTGGSISELEIQAHYFGGVLSKIFPWVTTGGDYAGRLTGFDTHGSDLIYLATDFAPFLLTVVLGVPLLKLCGRRKRPVLFAVAVVLGLAPFYNIQGDYFEMGSICTTRIVTEVTGAGSIVYPNMRSDDVFRTIEQFLTEPGELGISGLGGYAMGVVIVVASLTLSLFFAFLTYWMGHQLSRLLVRSGVARTGAA